MTRSVIRLLAPCFVLIPAVLFAQHNMSASTSKKSKMSDAEKMANAMSAAPASIAKHATLMDWPDTPDGQMRTLRAGTNGWVCYPNSPKEFGAASIDDPMCLDKDWQIWAGAWMTKTTPKVGATGVAYMLRGDAGVSNTDPFATKATTDNHWVVSPPHIMVLYSDQTMLDAFPTDPDNGGPWVMWKGTPYAHLMVPVSPTKTAATKSAKK